MKYVSVCSGVEAATLAWESLGWQPVWFSEIEPFPCEVLKYHYPNVPNLGDITKITVKNLLDGSQVFSNGTQEVKSNEKVDLLVGGTPCFTGETLVLTPFGYREIQCLNVGDEVISHMGNICKVTATGNKQANVGKIKVVGREKINCTDNHPFYVCWDDNKKSVKFDFTMAKYCTGKFAGRIYQSPELLDCDMESYHINLAGWFVGCGKIENDKVIIYLNSKKSLKWFHGIFDNKIDFTEDELKIIVNDDIANQWIKNNFFKYNKCCVPYFLYNYKHQDQFVCGYINATEQNCKEKFYYETKELALSFADLFANHSVKKDKSSGKWYSCPNKKIKFFGDRFASKVKEFKNGNDTTRTVYNITVEHDHSYIVEGIAVHNCQGFSVAGKQQGLNDARSAIALAYLRLLEEMQPRYFLWENVPGVLSTNGGNDFKQFLSKINEIGYCCAWKILDSQYVRVDMFPRAIPQRRRRVFVVGYLGDDWSCPAEILFEPQGLLGDNPPQRVKGKGFTSFAEGSFDVSDINSSE